MKNYPTHHLGKIVVRCALAVAIASGVVSREVNAAGDSVELLNVSYDPTRELLKDIGSAFTASYAKQASKQVTVKQSHGGSGTQARAVIEGLDADVVTLALWPDVDAIRKAGLIRDDWESRLPNNARPWLSTIVFVVRKGNPKGIQDWPDLVKPGVEIITPNPKTSGNGKLSLLAAWGSVTERGGTPEQALELVRKLYKQTPVLDSGARGSTVTFVQKEIGDVHLTWENEANLEIIEANGALEIVYPPISILADPPVAVVDSNVDRRGTRKEAEAYLNFIYSDEGQTIVAKHFYRPFNESIRKLNAKRFPDIKLFPITTVATGWDDANAKFFSDGKVFDSIYKP